MKYRVTFERPGEAVNRAPEIRQADGAAEALAMCGIDTLKEGDVIFVEAIQAPIRRFVHKGYAIKADDKEILRDIDSIPGDIGYTIDRINNGENPGEPKA